jgi:putative ATPase
MLNTGRLHSLVFWGPPGTGKTTLARLLAGVGDLHFEPMSAIFSGVADLRKLFGQARERREAGRGTLLFVDEIHRFNRAQQDGFLPYVEDGTVILVGATTENPSFELNGALLSRLRVMVLRRLDAASLETLLRRAETELGRDLPLDEAARQMLITLADGDGRYLLNMVEEVAAVASEPLDTATLLHRVQRRAPAHDKDGEGHFNLISALHKSLRGSDTDAALYWMARMIIGGEDPLYIARRLIRFASEDIGLADPDALRHALSAREAWHLLGAPEGELALVQAVIYLATAPKSNAAYSAWKAARKSAEQHGSLMPPAHILNAPTQLMKKLGYGKAYTYDHDTEHGFSGQNYFPDSMPRQRYYQPAARGFEREISRRLDYWDRLRSSSD